ncbi:hypothetical protein JZ751_004431 [Albula glossodonta]|uniref:Centriolar satellite-associated tubulin polyglutamylase complex regulator 1 n=1 Tax=Albula glossodonta TaxID=121402 RepID=A0A8T2N5N7_9TELE|nr:hypothetical protein JZ751_004431 [Albula glossodonta]
MLQAASVYWLRRPLAPYLKDPSAAQDAIVLKPFGGREAVALVCFNRVQDPVGSDSEEGYDPYYQKVDAVTSKDAYHIPQIEDCIDGICRAQRVSKFDLLKGYWQVPLTDCAKENRRQLMRILGTWEFYCKFVPNFASVTALFTDLLQKGDKWLWSLECQEWVVFSSKQEVMVWRGCGLTPDSVLRRDKSIAGGVLGANGAAAVERRSPNHCSGGLAVACEELQWFHPALGEFDYVKATAHNRASFIHIFWRCFRQIGKNGAMSGQRRAEK